MTFSKIHFETISNSCCELTSCWIEHRICILNAFWHPTLSEWVIDWHRSVMFSWWSSRCGGGSVAWWNTNNSFEFFYDIHHLTLDFFQTTKPSPRQKKRQRLASASYPRNGLMAIVSVPSPPASSLLVWQEIVIKTHPDPGPLNNCRGVFNKYLHTACSPSNQ